MDRHEVVIKVFPIAKVVRELLREEGRNESALSVIMKLVELGVIPVELLPDKK